MIDDLLTKSNEWKDHEIMLSYYCSITGKSREGIVREWVGYTTNDNINKWLYKRIKQMEKQDKIKELLK